MVTKLELLDKLNEKVCNCQKCPDLVANRTQTVLHSGNPNAKILFLGEAPGQDEDEQGEAFVGRAGQLLTSIISACGWERDKDVYICNILKCLDGSTKVLTLDGYKPISHIVKHKLNEFVACVDQNGNKQYKKITNWYRSLLSNRDLFKLILANGRKGTRPAGGTFTSDHEFLTQEGYIPIVCLQSNHKIHSGTMQPGPLVREMLIGTLLGDSRFAISSSNFCITHGYKQYPYLLHKLSILGANYRKCKFILTNINNSPAIGFSLPTSPFYRHLCKITYPNGIKEVTDELLDEFSPISLAFLYGDDGSINKKGLAEIATCSFKPSDVDKIIDALNKINIKAYRRPSAKYPRIHFDKINSYKLSEMVAPYIHPSLNYKILGAHKEIEKRLLQYSEEPFFDNYELIKVNKNPKWVYCIDVEDYHNFITTSGVVHNCRPPKNRTPTDVEAKNCEPYLKLQIKIINPKFIVCMGATAVRHLLKMTHPMGYMRGKWFKYEDAHVNADVICTYHPSYLLRNPAAKDDVAEDMSSLMEKVNACL